MPRGFVANCFCQLFLLLTITQPLGAKVQYLSIHQFVEFRHLFTLRTLEELAPVGAMCVRTIPKFDIPILAQSVPVLVILSS